MMTKEDYREFLEQIQEEYPHLEIVETNDTTTDYPSGIRKALVGFYDIDEAREVLEKYGTKTAKLYELDRPDGHHFFTRRGRMTSTESINTRSIIGDDCELVSFASYDSDEAFGRTLADVINSCGGSLNDILEVLKNSEEIINKVSQMDIDTEEMLIVEGRYEEIVAKEPVRFSYDTHNYVIGFLEL
jgi:hypothetical protein